MSIERRIERPDSSEVAALAAQLGFPSAAAIADQYVPMIDAALTAYDTVDEIEQDPPDRTDVPYQCTTSEDDPGNAWFLRAEITGTAGGPLTGRTIAIKDNIMVAGLPMASGARLLQGFIPTHDATVVQRVLAAGATIIGKTNCEYLCLSSGSHTSDFGPTHNPHRPGFTSGGSSSGNAVAVVTGDADLALGADQAGSIRVPASYSGLVGLKPTHGLVPYTGITPLEPVIDHVGPMTATVDDAALLLGVIAGYDDYDPRQRRVVVDDYPAALDRGLAGLRIGVLREGFGQGDPAVDTVVEQAAGDLRRLGADVNTVSVPLHARSLALWTPLVIQGTRDVVLDGQGFGTGRTERYPVELMEHLLARRERRDEMPPNVIVCALVAEVVARQQGVTSYARAVNAVRRLRHAYDKALTEVDALLMPTTPYTAPPLPAEHASIAERSGATNDMFGNTAAFNATHHPALSVPCGEVDGLPVGMMLVGRHHDESTVLRIGHGFEQR